MNSLVHGGRSVTVAILVGLVLLGSGCSLEDPKGRSIRAHALNHDGVFHAEPALHAERYCSSCHGLELAGGAAGEPSCLQCHGVRWQQSGPDHKFADADHTILEDRWYHNPSLNAPERTCTACHGLTLQGDKSLGTPSCYLCHDQVWP